MDIDLRKVLLATDGSRESGMAARRAAELSKATGAELHIVYVVDTRSRHPYAGSLPGKQSEVVLEQRRLNALALLDRQETLIEESWCIEARTHYREGDPIEKTATLAEELGTALIVVGCKDHKWLGWLFTQSFSDALVRRASCPVMVVRNEPAEKNVSGSANSKGQSGA